jgi:hypothetical protein
MEEVHGAEHDGAVLVPSPTPTPTLVVSELLCFIKQKTSVMAADVIKICADFYTSEEIEAARVKLSSYVNQKRVPRQKGTDSEVRLKTAGLMVKICPDPSVALPIFCAIEYCTGMRIVSIPNRTRGLHIHPQPYPSLMQTLTCEKDVTRGRTSSIDTRNSIKYRVYCLYSVA